MRRTLSSYRCKRLGRALVLDKAVLRVFRERLAALRVASDPVGVVGTAAPVPASASGGRDARTRQGGVNFQGALPADRLTGVVRLR